MKNEVCLVKEKQKLVEDNHNLIYFYAHRYSLDLEEYYDILAIALCKAAYLYNSETNYAFSTYAMKALRNAHLQHLREGAINRQIPKELIISLDTPVNDISELSLKDVIINKEDRYDYINLIETLAKFAEQLTVQENYVFYNLINELSISEIAKKLNIKPNAVSKLKMQIKQKWQKFQHVSKEKEK